MHRLIHLHIFMPERLKRVDLPDPAFKAKKEFLARYCQPVITAEKRDSQEFSPTMHLVIPKKR